MTNGRFDELFGGPPRNPESDIAQRHMDLAASIQAVTEDVMLAMGREVFRRTGMRRLVLAGGVALNCVGNGRLLREGPFDDIWIQPAAGDAGGALGGAMFVWHQLLEKPRETRTTDRQKGSFLGPRFAAGDIRGMLDRRRRQVPAGHRRGRPDAGGSWTSCPMARSSGGSRDGWSSAHELSAPAASSAIHGRRRCRRR